MENKSKQENKKILKDIINARRSIKKKVSSLKSEEFKSKAFLDITFLPITEPLNTLIKNEKKKQQNVITNCENDEMNDMNSKNNIVSKKKKINQEDITQYLSKHNIVITSENYDHFYGPYQTLDKKIIIGNKNFSINNKFIRVGLKTYTFTPGLIELIFKKQPLKNN